MEQAHYFSDRAHLHRILGTQHSAVRAVATKVARWLADCARQVPEEKSHHVDFSHLDADGRQRSLHIRCYVCTSDPDI